MKTMDCLGGHGRLLYLIRDQVLGLTSTCLTDAAIYLAVDGVPTYITS